MEGWFSIHRQIQDNELWFSERFTKAQAWIDLILLASHKPKTFFIRGNEIQLKRGELGYSILSLAERWKWNARTVNKFLTWLENRQMIHYRKTHLTTVISILNYDLYQRNTEQNAEQSKNRMQTNNNDDNDNKHLKPKRKNLNEFDIKNIPQNQNGSIYYQNDFFYVPETFKDELTKNLPGINENILQSEFYKMQVWLQTNGQKKNYRSFIINWLSKVKNPTNEPEFKFTFNPISPKVKHEQTEN